MDVEDSPKRKKEVLILTKIDPLKEAFKEGLSKTITHAMDRQNPFKSVSAVRTSTAVHSNHMNFKRTELQSLNQSMVLGSAVSTAVSPHTIM